jgi:hypothetical protein
VNHVTHHSDHQAWRGFLRLGRFLAWYGIGVALLMYGLPRFALLAQQHYESLSAGVRFFAVIGFFAVVAAWHIAGQRERLIYRSRGRRGGQSDPG